MKVVVLFTSIALSSTLGACNVVPVGPQPCTDLAAVSVGVTVTALDGALVSDAVVQFQPAGGEVAACEGGSDGVYLCGFEVAGEITVSASKDTFFAPDQTVTVEEDAEGCHVVQENVAMVLSNQIGG